MRGREFFKSLKFFFTFSIVIVVTASIKRFRDWVTKCLDLSTDEF